ncbi:sensor histidine kinase [Terrimonas pollutisoli]|uniref:sensor histidine kinase n=1 Tax=Terrimonas pollutisoli TaxID=3034147 RepID=UPI0023ECE76E|nr:HAMP domain-containing sensor histidine kinase [Terrimonas sp. H1YJ31]
MAITLRSSTIRLGIFISSLVIAIILIFQLVWLRKVYLFEQKEFDHSVVKAVRGLYEDLNIKIYNSSTLTDLIENPQPNLYLANISLPVSTDSLSTYLQYELEDFGIFTNCYIGLYNADSAKYTYTNLLAAPVSKHKNGKPLPVIKTSYNYLSLYFPNRKQYILSQLNVWIASSIILLLLLLFFGASLYYFYKQKFLTETQKDFLHSVTHEFKTPVSVLNLAAEVLKDPTIISKPEKLSTYAGIVEYQSQYLQKQIENLLRFAHTESHQLHLHKEKLELNQLIGEAITNLNPLIIEKKAKLTFQPGTSNSFLSADKDYMVIVIMNLIDNAIKYSKDPVIDITTKNEGSHVLLSIRDNGIGMDTKQLKKIFNKFFRIQNGEVYTAKGFGIGLSFVKKIVKAHNGNIQVDSSPGNGSKFTIELPYQ